MLIAGFMLPYGLGQAILGPLGDRLGKLRVACVAILLYGAVVIACGTASGMTALVAWRALSGLCAGAVIPLLMAYIGDVVPYAERQATIGRFLTGMVMAQMLTGPISGVIGGYAGWRMSFLALGIFAVLVGITLLLRFGRGLWAAPPTAGFGPVPGVVAYLRLLKLRTGRWLLISAFWDGFCLFGGAFPYVGAFLIGEFRLDTAFAGVLVAGFGVGSFLYTRFARRLVAKFGERGLLLLGGLGLSAGLAGLAAAPVWPVAAALQFAIGLMFYMFHGVLQARATEALPEARGAAVSAFALALFIGQTVGALSFGALLAFGGYRTAFLAASATMLALTVWSRIGLGRLPRAGEG
jgi:predicted MFS family arabinose efflux permease